MAHRIKCVNVYQIIDTYKVCIMPANNQIRSTTVGILKNSSCTSGIKFKPTLKALIIVASFATLIATAGEPLPDSEVYSSIINHGLEQTAKIVIIAEKTTGNVSEIAPPNDVEKVIGELSVELNTYINWKKRNRQKVTFDSILNLNVSYALLDEKTRKKIFDQLDIKTAWTKFSNRYHGAKNLLRFSNIGYNNQVTNALVYIEHLCGPECSSGRFINLSLVEKSWVVKGSNLVWAAY